MVSILGGRSSGLLASPGWGHCDLFLGKKIYFPSAFLPTSFPGYLILPPGASEERPWLGLVTCLQRIWEITIKLLKGGMP